jgi:LemA protein
MSTTLIIILILVVFVLMTIMIYNRLVKLRNNRENAFYEA